MGMTLMQLADLCERQSKVTSTAANEAAVSLAIDLVTKLVNKTPVDTTRAASGWVATLNEPSDEVTVANVLGKRGNTKDASHAITIAKAVAIIKKKKPSDTIFITNTVPYITWLNMGTSPQAPPLFIEKIIGEVRAKAKAGDYTKGK